MEAVAAIPAYIKTIHLLPELDPEVLRYIPIVPDRVIRWNARDLPFGIAQYVPAGLQFIIAVDEHELETPSSDGEPEEPIARTPDPASRESDSKDGFTPKRPRVH